MSLSKGKTKGVGVVLRRLARSRWLARVGLGSIPFAVAGVVFKWWDDAVSLVFGVWPTRWLAEYVATIPSWAASSTVFFGLLSLVLWFRIIALQRASLTIEFDPENIAECRLEGMGQITRNSISTPARWKQFRLRVSNSESKRTIYNCKGQLVFIQRVSGEGKFPAYVEKVPLTWAQSRNLITKDLASGEVLPLNLFLMFDGLPPEFQTESPNVHPPAFVTEPSDYEIEAVVFSDQTDQQTVQFRFHWTGKIDTANVENVRIF